MKVSVVIPVYNCEAYLRECVDSVLAQTHTDLDVILIDDGSTDGSPEICDAYAASDPRVRTFHGPNRGLSAARNKGIDAAQGDYISFVDADDTIKKHTISTLVSFASKKTIVSCAFYRDPELNEINKKEKKIIIHNPQDAISHFLYQKKDVCTAAWGHMIPINLFHDNLRFRQGIIYEDLDLMYRLYERTTSVVHVKSKLYYYRITPGSSIINTWNQSRLDVLDVTKRIEEYFSQNPDLLRAARDRSLSAAFNIFMLNEQNNGNRSVADRCYGIIKDRRWDSLCNPNVRLKNKIGIICSFFGPKFLSCLFRTLKHFS